jgi:NitT/TauT family transport system substrate-binding protein
LHLTEALLHGEGFSEVQYVNKSTTVEQRQAVASGEGDITQNFLGPALLLLDAGESIVLLAGVHVGCLELFGTDRVCTIRDLKGKTVAVPDLGGTLHVFLSSVAAYVGLDPRKDITWVTQPHAEAARLLAEGKIDAYLAGPPEAQMLRAQQIGHVVLNTMMDRPWSQYFFCMVTGNRAFVRKYPVATKRALRAIFKAVDRCGREPDLFARFLVDRGYTQNYGVALQGLQEIPYGTWRQYDPEDAVRFYALRLH